VALFIARTAWRIEMKNNYVAPKAAVVGEASDAVRTDKFEAEFDNPGLTPEVGWRMSPTVTDTDD